MANFDGVQIGSLWRNRSAKGNEYYSGKMGTANVILLENREATPENKLPTHTLWVSTPKPKTQPQSEV